MLGDKKLKFYSRDKMVNPVRLFNCNYITNREQLHIIHTHKNCAEVFLCIQGNAVHYINNQKQNLTQGALVFVRTDDIHGYIEPISADFQILNIRFDEEVLKDASSYLGRETINGKLLSPPFSPLVMIPKIDFPSLRNRMEKLFFLPEYDIQVIKLMFRIFLMGLLGENFLMPKMVNNRNIPDWIQGVLNEMHRPKNYVIGLQALYDIACKCPEHICREFKKHLKKTPTQVVNEIRLEEAARQLVYTDEKVINICGKVGFENLSHFHHQFRKLYSVSPLEFRSKFFQEQ